MVEKKGIVKNEKLKIVSPHETLWDQEVKPLTMTELVKQTADTEKMILFGESSSGKTSFYLNILKYLKKKGVPKEKILMCIVSSDRNSGLTKIHKLIPKEFLDNVLVFPIGDYEGLVSSTSSATKYLDNHFKKTGVHGWLVIELLEEAWRFSQDYYSRKAFGETLADLLAAKRQEIQVLMKSKNKEGKETAFQALEGFKDWVTIKFFHNFNWIDKVKRMPYNIVCTAELREEENVDSMFSSIKWRPAGEKDNIHRFDTIIYLKHENNKFAMRSFKITGFTKIYSEIPITGKNPYEEHMIALGRLTKLGYNVSKFDDLEKQAGIVPPKAPVKPEESHTISKTDEGESRVPISKEEITTPPKEEKNEEENWDMNE